MFCYVRSGFKFLDVSFMFLFNPRFESSAGLTYIATAAACATDLVYDIGLFFGKWSGLWGREMLF